VSISVFRQKTAKWWLRFNSCSGQGIAEYAWILVLVFVVAILLLRTIGVTVNNMLSDTNSNMPR